MTHLWNVFLITVREFNKANTGIQADRQNDRQVSIEDTVIDWLIDWAMKRDEGLGRQRCPTNMESRFQVMLCIFPVYESSPWKIFSLKYFLKWWHETKESLPIINA